VEDIKPSRERITGGATREGLIIRYNPGDTVYGPWGTWDPHPRRNRLGFVVYQDDWQVLHYDAADMESVEYYLDSRLERGQYLKLMPVLEEIRRRRLEEIELEKGFVKLVAGRLDCSDEMVWDAIHWWKMEIVPVWKRPITKDDAKALRMIERRIKSQMKKGVKSKEAS